MATLKEVAERAGISVSTASYVLNGKKKVRPETRERILRAADEVGYIPNQIARGLRTKRSGSIGIIVPDISNEFFPEIVRGIEDYVNQNNYSMILCNSDNNLGKEQKYINTLIGKDIDGIIFIGTGKSPDALSAASDIPIVLVDRKLGDQLRSVTTNNRLGAFLATEHLIRCGYQSIALLSGPLYSKTFYDRMSGYMEALKKYGIHYDENLVCECEMADIQHGYESAKALMLSGAADAIFSMNDLMALGTLRALWELGVSVPKDISVIGYDDIAYAAISTPALSTVRQPKYEMGWEAAALLMECIENPAGERRHIELEPSLVLRETTYAKKKVPDA